MSEPENAKIIAFPNEKIVRRPVLNHYVEELKKEGKLNFADSLTDQLMNMLLENLHDVGIDITDPIFVKDISLTTSILRATIFRNFELDHPMHQFIDRFVAMAPVPENPILDTDEE